MSFVASSLFAKLIGPLMGEIVRPLWNNTDNTKLSNWNSKNINEFYRDNGFNFVIRVNSIVLYELADIIEWCNNNSLHRWVRYWHKAKNTSDGFLMDELGGEDYVCFAFENEADALLFSLKWAS
jgi:hypothetical protein